MDDGHPLHPLRSRMTGQAPAFEARMVRKIYAQGRASISALSDINLTIASGEFVVVAGPSGSGKSTLLHLLAGLDRPDGGSILVGGQDLTALTDTGRALVRRHQLGFVFQAFNLVPVLSAFENVEYGLWLNGTPRTERQQRVTDVLTTVGLADRLHHRPDHLSGGERQRVALARALVHDPIAILADEPTASLDSATADTLLDMFVNLNQSRRTTFVVATHDSAIMERAPRVVRLTDGRIVSDRTVTRP